MNEQPLFLTDDEVVRLTGCKAFKLQIDTLRKNGLQFTLNRRGKPVVPRCAIEGVKSKQVEQKPAWTPKILKKAS